MAVNLVNSFEGGTNGTTVSAANSGGSSGNAFNAVTIGASATLTFDNAEAAHGTLSAKLVNPSVATSCILNWSASLTGTSLTQAWFRVYVFLPSLPSATLRLVRALSTATFLGAVSVNSSGKVTTLNNAGTVQTTSTVTVPVNQWFRLEGYFIGSATAGQIQVKIFTTSMDELSPDETDTTGAAINTGGTINTLSFGDPSSIASFTMWLDDLGASDTGYLGPALVSVPGAVSGLVLAAPAGSVSAGASVSGVTAALALAAPAGSVSAGATVAGAVAGLVFAAPPGSVTVTGPAVPAAPPPTRYLVVPPHVSWQAGNGAAVTTLAPFAPDFRGPPNIAPWYVPFAGFIERLPQQWDELLRGFTEASITDAWFGANSNPQPILVTEILNDNPYAYWPCTDAAGATLASNVAPGNLNPLFVTESKYGSGASTTQAFGQNSSALLGAQQTVVVQQGFRLTNEAGMWGQTLGGSVAANQGSSLTCNDGDLPQPRDGTTVEFWFQTAAPFNTGVESFLAMGVSAASFPTFLIYLNIVDGRVTLNTSGSSGVPDFVELSTTGNLTGTPPLTFVALSYNSTSYTAYVNGTEAAAGHWGGPVHALGTVLFNGAGLVAPGTGGVGGFYSGFTGHIAIFPFILPANRIQTHYQAGITALTGEPSQNRIERLLQAGGTTGRRVIQKQGAPFVTPVVSCQDIPGQPVSQSISSIASNLLPGMLYVAPSGEIFALARQNAWGQQAKWILGERIYAGEYPYRGDVTFDYDPTRVQNQIQLTQLDNQDIVVPSVPAIEAASQRQYSTVSNLTTGYLEGDATKPLNAGPGLYDLANWLATTYRKPALRLTKVTIDAAADPSRWPFVLGASAGDVVQVNRRPPSSGDTVIPVTGRITQTARPLKFSTQGVSASVTCVVDTAPETGALTLDDPVNGLLDGNHPLAW